MNKNERISLDALLFSIYVACTPINQILKLGNGSTINKYIGLAVIIVLVLNKMISGEGLTFTNYKIVMPMLLWFGVSVIWSINQAQTVKSIISLGNYILLWLLVTDKTWNNSEKKIIMYMSIAVGIYISYLLIVDQLAGVRRSTLKASGSGEVDQNALAVALAILVMMSFYLMLSSNIVLIKAVMIIFCLLFVVGIFCTGSRSSLIALTVGFVYYIVAYISQSNHEENGGIIFFLFSAGILLYLIIGKKWIINDETLIRYTNQDLLLETGGTGRTDIWKMYIDILNNTIYPYFIGFGYGTTFLAFVRYKWNWAPGTHNTYLYLLVGTGIVGLFLFVQFIFIHIKKSTENNDILSKSCIFVVMVAMISLDFFTKKDLWNVFIFAQIGLGCSTILCENESTPVFLNSHRHYRYIK